MVGAFATDTGTTGDASNVYVELQELKDSVEELPERDWTRWIRSTWRDVRRDFRPGAVRGRQFGRGRLR